LNWQRTLGGEVFGHWLTPLWNNWRPVASTGGRKRKAGGKMRSRSLTCLIATSLFGALAIPVRLAAQDNHDHKHHHYKLIVLGTLGGPQSYGDAGHGAANITSQGTAAGVADTAIPDPFYPNYNPLFSPAVIGRYPFVYHVFTSKDGALLDLGGVAGNSSTANFITDNGLVAGLSLNGAIDPLTGWPQVTAVLWRDGQIVNLGALAGGYESGTSHVNSRGQVAGSSTNDVPDPFSIFYFVFAGFSGGTQTRAFFWEESDGMQDLGTLGGSDAVAFLMNERGQIAGSSFTNSIPNPTTGFPTTDPFLWENGKMIDLGSLGGTNGGPNDINNRGQVVGLSNLAGDTEVHPFLWDNGKLRDLGTLGGSFFGSANALNDAGDIVGQAATASGELHAFLWKRGVMTDLGPVPGFGDSTCVGAFRINSHDQVVGQAVANFCAGPAAHAFLWENGDMIDLNQFLPPGSDITLIEVEQINDRGEMFGQGMLTTGEDRAFLLIPCDDDHPGIEGCNYSMMDASAAASAQPSMATATRHTPPATPLWRTQLRLQPFSRRFGPVYPAAEAQSKNRQ
jgi:probable HAF family extracellular repeat protein